MEVVEQTALHTLSTFFHSTNVVFQNAKIDVLEGLLKTLSCKVDSIGTWSKENIKLSDAEFVLEHFIEMIKYLRRLDDNLFYDIYMRYILKGDNDVAQ